MRKRNREPVNDEYGEPTEEKFGNRAGQAGSF
jgi:hypothetical protein